MTTIKLSKKSQVRADDWAARVQSEDIAEGMDVSVKRVTTNALNHIITEWWEPATIVEVRRFDAVAIFRDGTKSSTGLGLKTGE